MAKIIVKSAKFGIVVKELDTADYHDGADLIQDLLQAIPEADWFEARLDGDSAYQYSHPTSQQIRKSPPALIRLQEQSEAIGEGR